MDDTQFIQEAYIQWIYSFPSICSKNIDITCFTQIFDNIEVLGFILTEIFPDMKGNIETLEQLVSKINEIIPNALLECDVNHEDPQFIIQILEFLIFQAVSTPPARRSIYVRNIMTLDVEYQQALMKVIEQKMREGENQPEIERSPSPKTPHKIGTPVQQLQSPLIPPGTPCTPENLLIAALQSTPSSALHHMGGEVTQLRREVEEGRRREGELLRELEGLKVGEMFNSLSQDVKGIQLKEDMESQVTLINSLQREVEGLSEQLEEEKGRGREVEGVREEMAALRERVKGVERMEEQINKYRGKLEEMKDIKRQLKREEGENTKLVEEVCKLENDVENLKRVENELVSQRERCTQLEAKNCELQLMAEESEFTRIDDGFKTMLGERGEVDIRVGGVEGGDGCEEIFGGVSDMNPKIRAELEHLRETNKSLQTKLSEASEEKNEELRISLRDQEEMREKFQTDYFSTKKALNYMTCEKEKLDEIVSDKLTQVRVSYYLIILCFY